MESLPNEIILVIFSYLKSYDIVYAFYSLNHRFACLIHAFRPFSTSINLVDAPLPIFKLFHSLLFQSQKSILPVDTRTIDVLKLDCHMLCMFALNRTYFPRLQSLSVIVRKPQDLNVLLKHLPFFTTMIHLYIRSDVCCCDRLSFEENVKQNLFQSISSQLESLTFATPPCYSISLQDVALEQCRFTNLTLTVRSMSDLCTILSNVSLLRSLRIRLLNSHTDHHTPVFLTSSPPHLERLLFICLHSISYETIETIFKPLTSLRQLCFSLIFDVQSGIIDGYRLRDDILMHLPDLSAIQFEIKSMVSMASLVEIIKSFQTPFWSRFAPVGFHSCNHMYTLPFQFHHLDLDQSILNRQQSRNLAAESALSPWRFVRDVDLHDHTPYSNEFLTFLRDDFVRLTALTLKWKFRLMNPMPVVNTWLRLPMVRRITIRATQMQDPNMIKEFLLCLPYCETFDCDYVLVARITNYFRSGSDLTEFGNRLRTLIVDELPSDWKIEKKKRKNLYFRRFRHFFPNIECSLYT